MITYLLALSLSSAYVVCCEAVTCSTMADCSYNGVCKDAVCECFPQWMGWHCASLNIVPGHKDAGLVIREIHTYVSCASPGLQSVVNGSRQTSWGGGAVYDAESQSWHMIASEMTDGCGMSVWLSNSQLVHATSSSADGQYVRRGPVEKTGIFFSHEPNLVRARDTGETVVFFTHIYPPATFKYPCSACADGETKDCPTTGDDDYGRNWDAPLPTKMMYTSNLSDAAAWSELIDVANVSPDVYIDSNLACYIFPNGSLIGILRNDAESNAKTYNLVTAAHWKLNASYERHAMRPYDNANTTQLCYYGEDPFIWFDDRYDVVHSLWHYTYDGTDFANGIHAFSTDGGHSFHAFLDFGISDYAAEWAYNQTAFYVDGTSQDFLTAERPHLIFAQDGYTPGARG